MVECTKSFLIVPIREKVLSMGMAPVESDFSGGMVAKQSVKNSTFGSSCLGRRFGNGWPLGEWKIEETIKSNDCSAYPHWTTTKPTDLKSLSRSLPYSTFGRSKDIAISTSYRH